MKMKLSILLLATLVAKLPFDAPAQEALSAETAMMDALEAKIDTSSHLLGAFTDRHVARRASDILREAKVSNVVRSLPPKEGTQTIYRLQVNPKDLPKITPEVQKKLKPFEGDAIRGLNYRPSTK